MDLATPDAAYLDSYIHALEAGWSPDNMRPDAGRSELASIAADSEAFLLAQTDRKGLGAPIVLPDGSTAVRVPGYRQWMWDGEFCGAISFRWQPGTTALPPYCLGHIGFSVVPWKRRRGYASRALALVLPRARREGLEFVELTTSVSNIGSQRTIEANGGLIVERFRLPAAYGDIEDFRYRIYFDRNGLEP